MASADTAKVSVRLSHLPKVTQHNLNMIPGPEGFKSSAPGFRWPQWVLTNSDHAEEGATDQLAAGEPQQIPQGRPSTLAGRLWSWVLQESLRIGHPGTQTVKFRSSASHRCGPRPVVTTRTSRRRATGRGSRVTGRGGTADVSLQGGPRRLPSATTWEGRFHQHSPA